MSAALETNLAELLGVDVDVVDRRRNDHTSTSPSEILTCRLTDGRELRLLCKHASGPHHKAFGHRGGLQYEGLVYREVVNPSGLTAARCWGELPNDEPVLVIDFVEHAVCVDEATPIEAAMRIAARWIGRFHRINEHSQRPLNRYDSSYYRLWVRRTAELAGDWHARLTWLRTLCSRAEEQIGSLVDEQTTVIHGEYTPHNVLIRDGNAFPVDWESAAIALGEIDLACLTDKWPAAIASLCEDAYAKARWPEGGGDDFRRRLDLARLYWDFRWLGDRPEWTTSERVGPRFEHLRTVSERLGLL